MDTMLENDEAENRAMVTFSTYGTSGGMVNNVQNGNVTMGDQIDYIEHAVIYNTFNIVAPDEVERFRSMYPPGFPPNESTTTNTIPILSPSLGVAQPHSPSASGPLTNQVAINGFTVTCDPSASAADSLFEIRVIVDIMDALIENPSLRHSITLPETLASLQRILKMTQLAVRLYQDTPLAQTLSLAIIAETEYCRQLLKELLKNMSNCRHVLSAAMLHYIRQYIWSRTGECGASAELNSKLRACHSSFAACILALGSFASHELEWGTGAGDLAELHSFSLLFKQELMSLQHIRSDTVIVVDHLGRHLPVPTIFCDSRQDFHVVITGFCKDQAGGSLIQRGDYRILSLDDDQVINPAEFHTALQPGMTVGMTIVLREQIQERNSNEEHRCPRPGCNHINSKVITVSGWVSCRRCNGQFQISPEDDSIISPDIQEQETSPLPDEISLFRRICILQDGMRYNEGIASEIFDNHRLNETSAGGHESHEFIADQEEAASRLSAITEDGIAAKVPEQREAELEAKIDNGTEQIKKLKVPWLQRIFTRPSLGNTERSTKGLQTERSKALSPEASERADRFLPKPETTPDIHAASKSGKSSAEITPPPRNSFTMGDYLNIPLRDIASTDDCIIIMGVTGAGKSTFVAHAAGGDALDNNEHIGHSLLSRTDAAHATRVTNRHTSRSVVLLDTPGFDDTNNPDQMVLETIADWLKASGRTDIRLAGVIYLHRISDNRMNKSKLNNLTMLQDFVGAEAMPNIAFATTLWSSVEKSRAENRETVLCSTFWGEMMDNGATYCRFEDTTDSAWDIITPLLYAEPFCSKESYKLTSQSHNRWQRMRSSRS